MQQLETAMSWGVRPTAVILGKDDRKRWGRWDILLAEAYQILQSERCGQCGLPKYVCQSTNEDIQFSIEDEECAATAKVAKADAAARGSGKKQKEPEPGLRRVPRPFTVSGRDFSDLRDDFYKEQARRREEIEKSRRPDLAS